MLIQQDECYQIYCNSRVCFPFFVDPRVKLNEHDGLANATLRIEDIDFDDRAVYMCSAVNEFGVGNNTVMVRVKGEYRRNLQNIISASFTPSKDEGTSLANPMYIWYWLSVNIEEIFSFTIA